MQLLQLEMLSQQKEIQQAEFGTVFIAIATPNEVFVEEFNFGQPREKVIDRAVNKSIRNVSKRNFKKSALIILYYRFIFCFFAP